MRNITKHAKNILRFANNLTKLTKKLVKSTVKGKFILTCFNVGAKVHSLIPKYDKIEGIDTDKLIREHKYES